jgi:hypothetical protein
MNVLYCPGTTSGSSSSGASGGSSDAAVVYDALADGPADDGASSDSAAGVSDATVQMAPSDAGSDACVRRNGGGTAPTGNGAMACASIALSANPVFTVGTATITPEDSGVSASTEDSGVVSTVASETDATIQNGIGGISAIPCQFLNGSSCPAGQPAYKNTNPPSTTGVGSAAKTVTGLTNGVHYSVAVAAVDGSGNVGPQSSPEQCATPAPIDDFYKVYRLAGGTAGGGFCSLDAAGAPVDLTVLAVPAAATAFGLARRRRRRKS